MPKCFILENVKGLVRHDNGQTIKKIIEELEKSVHSTTYKVITSLNCGVAQMRQRVYFVGIRKDIVTNISDFVWPTDMPILKPEDYLIDRVPISTLNLDILKRYLVNATNAGKYTIEDLSKMNGKDIEILGFEKEIYQVIMENGLIIPEDLLFKYTENDTISNLEKCDLATKVSLTGQKMNLLDRFIQDCIPKLKDFLDRGCSTVEVESENMETLIKKFAEINSVKPNKRNNKYYFKSA